MICITSGGRWVRSKDWICGSRFSLITESTSPTQKQEASIPGPDIILFRVYLLSSCLRARCEVAMNTFQLFKYLCTMNSFSSDEWWGKEFMIGRIPSRNFLNRRDMESYLRWWRPDKSNEPWMVKLLNLLWHWQNRAQQLTWWNPFTVLRKRSSR